MLYTHLNVFQKDIKMCINQAEKKLILYDKYTKSTNLHYMFTVI